VEAWATVARTNAANDVRRAIGAQTLAEGHTLDDQAETVLMNLIPGGGRAGVGAAAGRGGSGRGGGVLPGAPSAPSGRPDEPGHEAIAQRDPPARHPAGRART